ncbi:hypothetical protein ACJH6J_02510 [Mycobacterium sp. SMC-18]|uniref:hypothetical protein n=1 Tax=Mycobacterium sp. SMC-18 TaxID=3381629 RepID=UPI0038776B62
MVAALATVDITPRVRLSGMASEAICNPAALTLATAAAIAAAPAGPPTPVTATAAPATMIAVSMGLFFTNVPTAFAPDTVAEAALDTALLTALAALETVLVIESNNPAGSGPPPKPPTCSGGSTYTGHWVSGRGSNTSESWYKPGRNCRATYDEGTSFPAASRVSAGANIPTVSAAGVARLIVRYPLVWASITVSAGVRTKVVTIRTPVGLLMRATVRVPVPVFSARKSKPAPRSG